MVRDIVPYNANRVGARGRQVVIAGLGGLAANLGRQAVNSVGRYAYNNAGNFARSAGRYVQQRVEQYLRRENKRVKVNHNGTTKPNGTKQKLHSKVGRITIPTSFGKGMRSRYIKRYKRRTYRKRRRRYVRPKGEKGHLYLTNAKNPVSVMQGQVQWFQIPMHTEADVQTIKTDIISPYLTAIAPANAQGNHRWYIGKTMQKHLVRNCTNSVMYITIYDFICKRDCQMTPYTMLLDAYNDSRINAAPSNATSSDVNWYWTFSNCPRIKKFWKIKKMSRIQINAGETKIITQIRKGKYLYNDAVRDDCIGTGTKTAYIAGLTQVLCLKIIGCPTHEIDADGNGTIGDEDLTKISTSSGQLDIVTHSARWIYPILATAEYNYNKNNLSALNKESVLTDLVETKVDT